MTGEGDFPLEIASALLAPPALEHPHDEVAERSLLSGLMNGASFDVIFDVATTLNAEDFFVHRHRPLYLAILNVAKRSEKPDTVTVHAELMNSGQLDAVGGVSSLSSIVDEMGLPSQCVTYARIVTEQAGKRQAIENLHRAHGMILHEGREPQETIQWLANSTTRRTPEVIPADRLPIPFESIPDSPREEVPWVWGGFLALGRVTMLAGAPKAGKSTLMGHYVRCHVRREPFLELGTSGCPVLWWAGDEHWDDVKARLKRLGVSGGGWIIPRMHNHAEQELKYIEGHIRSKGAGLLIADSASQIMDIESENDSRQVTAAMTRIRNIAREHNVAVLLIHHMRKNTEADEMAIRGSSALLAEVDNAILFRAYGTLNRRMLTRIGRYQEVGPRTIYADLTDHGYEVVHPEVARS